MTLEVSRVKGIVAIERSRERKLALGYCEGCLLRQCMRPG
jgi:hypothetical protein